MNEAKRSVPRYLSAVGTETATNLHQKLYYHVLGTPQAEDSLCAEFPEQPKWMSGVEVSSSTALP